MGMNVCNVRVLPMDSKIVKDGCYWMVAGNADITERELIQALLMKSINILERNNQVAASGKSYLINDGIEMLIGCNESKIKVIEFRIALSWIEEGLSECFDVLKVINEFIPIKYWINNDSGEEIDSKEVFIEKHLEFISEKKKLFDSAYSEIMGIRLLEAEINECYEKRNRKIFKFRTKRKQYKKIKRD
ncbi:MAG: hypothetical protein IKT67_00035 [Lachnospiraceae bacterium]|nr:hypothetical protein [Lachnospiraceae bacterium]